MDRIFRQLHEGDLLILPNAWDAGSARLIESRGAKAIATTSAGLAWSNGYPDGDALPVDRLVAAARSIARVIAVPLTTDIEGGYSDDPAAVSRTVDSISERNRRAEACHRCPKCHADHFTQHVSRGEPPYR